MSAPAVAQPQDAVAQAPVAEVPAPAPAPALLPPVFSCTIVTPFSLSSMFGYNQSRIQHNQHRSHVTHQYAPFDAQDMREWFDLTLLIFCFETHAQTQA